MLLLTYKRQFPILIPTKIEFAAYCEKLGYVGLVDAYKDKDWKPVTISGRVLREMYIIGEIPDPRVICPGISKILIESYNKQRAL